MHVVTIKPSHLSSLAADIALLTPMHGVVPRERLASAMNLMYASVQAQETKAT